MNDRIKTEQVLTPEFTLYFPDLEQVNPMSKKYRVVAVWDAGEKLTGLKNAIKAAAISKWGQDIPADLYIPIKKPEDEKTPDMYPADTLHAAASTKKPYLVDRDPNVALTPDKFYPGCRCRAVVTPWPYDGQGKNPPGVTLFLDTLQFVADGDPIGGGVGRAKNMLTANPLDSQDADQEIPTVADDEGFDFGF